ncbi:hypothetical protein FF2_040319 [Malus domestica]
MIAIRQAKVSSLILFTFSLGSNPYFSWRKELSSQCYSRYLAKELNPCWVFPHFFSKTSRQKACMPSIPATHEARDLHIFLNHWPGPRQVQELKRHKPYGSPDTASQRLNLRPQQRK